MKISFPLISTLLVSLFLFSSFLSKNSSDYDFEGFSSLPIMDEGRVQPIDSFSRNLLTMVSGKSSVLDSNGKKPLNLINAEYLLIPKDVKPDEIFSKIKT